MATRATRGSKRRLHREDWENAALDAIAREGLASVGVEPLARHLGVTKGSFYAHFSTRDELVEAALHRWAGSQGDLSRFADIADPAERLTEMLTSAIAFSQSGTPSVHISLLGELHDARVREAVGAVSRARLELLERSYRELGLPPRRAADRARLAYATYLGLMQTSREAPKRRLAGRELTRFIDEVRAALVE